MRGFGGWSGTEIYGPRNAAAGMKLAEVRHFAIDPQRKRVGTVHVLFKDRHPIIRQIARQFELHALVVDRDSGR